MSDTDVRRSDLADADRMTELMIMYPEVWANHRQLSAYLTTWAGRVLVESRDRTISPADAEYLSGYHRALSDIVTHLDHGECLPGGPICRAVGPLLRVVSN